MRHWFRDQHFRSLLKNSSYLAISKAIAAVAALASLAFAGRGLGVALLGVLILINSYAKAISGLSKFQSWQLIVRYGGDARDDGDAAKLKAATGFALSLDLLSGAVGLVVAVALLPLIGTWFGIEDRYLVAAMFYCTLIPTMGSTTPIGVLRALDRFDLISWQGTTYPIARATLFGGAWAAGAPFETFLLFWYLTDVGGDLYLWFLARRELRRRGLRKGIRLTFRPKEIPGAWRFSIHVNLTASLMTAWGPIGRLLVGGLLGPAGAGLYRVASSLADSAQSPADLLAKAFFPQVVRMDMATKQPWKLMVRGTTLAAAFGLVVVLFLLVAGRWLLDTLFGVEFAGAYPVLLILIGAPILIMVSFPLPYMLYALDRPDGPLKARLLGTLAYFAVLAPLCVRFGVTGAAAAFVLGTAVMVLVLALHVRAARRRLRVR